MILKYCLNTALRYRPMYRIAFTYSDSLDYFDCTCVGFFLYDIVWAYSVIQDSTTVLSHK